MISLEKADAEICSESIERYLQPLLDRGGTHESLSDNRISFAILEGRDPQDGVTLHVDHVTPFSLGGLTVLSNLQTLCDLCNLEKGNRSDRFFGHE
jgi:hypothetical protein